MAWLQDIAINTLWYNADSGSDDFDPTEDTPPANVVNGAVAINTDSGKIWVKVTNGGLSGWEAVGGTSIANPLTVDAGGTGVQTLTQDGVLIGNAANAITAVDLSTKGRLLAGDGSGNPQYLSVGATDGHVLTVASGQATGMQWAAAPAAGAVDGSGATNRFAIWTDSDTLGYATTGTSASFWCDFFYVTDTNPYFSNISATDYANDLQIGSAGVLTREGSSRRYKENIVDLAVNSANIYNLVPKTFKWRDTTRPERTSAGAFTGETVTVTGKTQFGYIAEEVHAVLPEIVTYNESDEPDGVLYKMLSVLLLEEMKRLKARIEVLEAG